jgi:hypothetical protein
MPVFRNSTVLLSLTVSYNIRRNSAANMASRSLSHGAHRKSGLMDALVLLKPRCLLFPSAFSLIFHQGSRVAFHSLKDNTP